MRRAQRRAAERQDLLRVTLASIGDGVITTDTRGRITALNTVAEALTGWMERDAIGESLDRVLRLVNESTRERVDNPATRALRECFVVGPQTVLIGKDGVQRTIEASAGPITAAGGQVLGCVVSFRDITDMQKNAAALASEIETTRAFFESAAEGIVIVSQAGQILSLNPRAAAMFGYAHTELIGQPIERLLPERFRGAHRGHRADYFAAPRARSMGLGLELFGQRKDGTDFPIEISLSPIDTPDGPVAMALVTDVRERRSLERAARQHEKLAALATLSAGIAHELNNPIGIISTRIDLMLQDNEAQPLSSELTEDLQVLHRNIQRVIRIARGLLSFARQSPEQQRSVLVNTVVEETLLLVGKQLARDGIQLSVDLTPNLDAIWGDPDALQQLVTNLLLNGRDAMPRGGDLRVETSADPHREGWVRLEVADTGDGMPPDRLEKIWEPFYTTKTTGTGLGLSVSRRIIEEHRGTVNVSSEPGRGTTFTIRFPSHSRRSTTPSASPD